MSKSKKQRGYWNNFANVQQELQQFIDLHGTPGIMPTFEELLTLGYSSLCNAIQKHGGFYIIADQLGLKPYHKVKGYWHDFDNVKQEVEEFVAEQGNLGYMPTAGQLNRAGHYSLVIAICKHGGFSVTAEKLGLVQRRKVRGYWQDFANVQQEIEDFVAECGVPGEMPSVLQLNLAGCRSLAVAINKHGGFDAVAQKLGLKAPDFTYTPAQNSVSEEQQVYEFA